MRSKLIDSKPIILLQHGELYVTLRHCQNFLQWVHQNKKPTKKSVYEHAKLPAINR